MKDFKVFTEELKTKFLECLQSEETKNALEKIKKANESGRFKVVISTDNKDRQGEIVEQIGADVSFFKKNPVVLWAHDYQNLPIGLCDKLELIDNKWVAEGIFAPEEANPFAQQVRKLYDGGFIKATSIGFLPKKREENIIKEWELLEFSFVPVPANPFALDLTKMGFNVEELIFKGIILKADEPKKITKPEPEVTEEYIRIRVQDPANFDQDSFRTIDVSAEEGIKAIVGCPSGEYEGGKCNVGMEVQSYLFDKEKWSVEEAQNWVAEHEGQEGKNQDKKMEKSGRVLSSKNRTLITNAISQMENSIVALRDLLKATEPQGDESGDKTNKGREPVGREYREYLTIKSSLQIADKAIEETLKKMKEKLRKGK